MYFCDTNVATNVIKGHIPVWIMHNVWNNEKLPV